MKRVWRTIGTLEISILALAPVGQANAQDDVDLSTWTAESYAAVAGFGAGVWTVAGDTLSVYQSVNGQPTFFFSDFLAFNTSFQGKIKVETTGDDDFIGFALGFQPGDTSNSSADYLLVDWKQGNQSANFGSPSCTPGSFAPRGLAVSQVSGIPTADEFWGHTNFDSPACSDLSSGLAELQRGLVSGGAGWGDFVEYEFQFDFTATSLKVFVDGVLELDISGSFADGRIAFYNFSQACVRYSGFTVTPLGACCNEMAMTCEDGITEEDCQSTGGQWFEDMICSDLDGDGDGFPACAGDCNDSDPDVNPGAEEVCNGVDDNCDGVVDEGCNLPPDCSLAVASVDELWPPNHKLRSVSIEGVTDPDGDPVTITITGIFQDEPVEGLGDGNTCPDATGLGQSSAMLRAERSGLFDGRVYHISFVAEDGQGGECTGTVTVCVPHDQDPDNDCVDQGPIFISTECDLGDQ